VRDHACRAARPVPVSRATRAVPVVRAPVIVCPDHKDPEERWMGLSWLRPLRCVSILVDALECMYACMSSDGWVSHGCVPVAALVHWLMMPWYVCMYVCMHIKLAWLRTPVAALVHWLMSWYAQTYM
jgi:hypothetical protein